MLPENWNKRNMKINCFQANNKGFFDVLCIIHTPFVETHGSTDGSRAILLTARLNSPVAVRTVTTRTTSSFPGWIAEILPRRHCWGGAFSSTRSTNAPMSNWLTPPCHFWRVCRWCKYSVDHLFQKCCCISWICCHLFSRLIFSVLGLLLLIVLLIVGRCCVHPSSDAAPTIEVRWSAYLQQHFTPS